MNFSPSKATTTITAARMLQSLDARRPSRRAVPVVKCGAADWRKTTRHRRDPRLSSGFLVLNWEISFSLKVIDLRLKLGLKVSTVDLNRDRYFCNVRHQQSRKSRQVQILFLSI